MIAILVLAFAFSQAVPCPRSGAIVGLSTILLVVGFGTGLASFIYEIAWETRRRELCDKDSTGAKWGSDSSVQPEGRQWVTVMSTRLDRDTGRSGST